MQTQKVRNSLDDYKLEYEDMEMKVPQVKSKVAINKEKPNAKVVKTDAVKRKAKPALIGRIKAYLKADMSRRSAQSRSGFNDIMLRLKPAKKPSKLSKKAQKEQQKAVLDQHKRGILGLGLLFVVVSITYSSYVILNGVHSTASRVMLVPQVVFALLTLIKAFSKIYK